MATLTIRNLDEETKALLRVAAAHHGQSMEEEVREILRQVLTKAAGRGLGSRVHQRFVAAGGVELPERQDVDAPRAAELPQ
ncbi:MAG: plasmid stabilization protein [Myxococcales bacterium]|nr:plasmid stabilization protein [Myxococcales bacterium]